MFHACKYQRSGYRKLIKARRRYTHNTKQWSYQGPEALYSLFEIVVLSWPGGAFIIVRDNDHLIKARRRCGDPFGATVIQTGSMSSTQTGPRYQNKTCMLQTYFSYWHANLSLYLVRHRQSVLLHFLYISHKHE